MRNCCNIDELCQIAYDNREEMSPRDISAFWTLAAKFIKIRDPSDQTNWQEEIPQIQELLLHTLERVGSNDSSGLDANRSWTCKNNGLDLQE